jgi:hypothetical protein
MRVGGDADEGLPLLVQRARGSETQRHSHQRKETSSTPEPDMHLAAIETAFLCLLQTASCTPDLQARTPIQATQGLRSPQQHQQAERSSNREISNGTPFFDCQFLLECLKGFYGLDARTDTSTL